MENKCIYYIVTDEAVYRSDTIQAQIDTWVTAFKKGTIIPMEDGPEEALDEFQAHLENSIVLRNNINKEYGDSF